jgi:UDPglucose 6-dehydrogenase
LNKKEKNGKLKITVVGLGFVGTSIAVLLAQHHEVVGVDISQDRVDMLNDRKSPIIDTELSEYLSKKELNLFASTDLEFSVTGSDYVVVCTPTNYDEETNFFDTSSLEKVIKQVAKLEPKTCIVIKSTIPIGFTDEISKTLNINNVIFSPEFLREGTALRDNLYPSRIIVGEKSKRAQVFANLLVQGALKSNIEILFCGAREAEAIKLFCNSYLAMRVAFFNELDTYAHYKDMNCREIIEGVSLDPRIGSHYNNPSFGYGGYCLPKDTKQLLSNYHDIPQNLYQAIVDSNATRKAYLTKRILEKRPKVVGIYRLVMKEGSDNFRESAIIEIMRNIQSKGIRVIIFEPTSSEKKLLNADVISDLAEFKTTSDVILANRTSDELSEVMDKVFTRDVFNEN